MKTMKTWHCPDCWAAFYSEDVDINFLKIEICPFCGRFVERIDIEEAEESGAY